MAHRVCFAVLAAWTVPAAADSYTHFTFQETGPTETHVVSEGVAVPYNVEKKTYFTQGFELLPGQMLFTDPSKTLVPMPHGEYAILGVVGDVVTDDGHGSKAPTPLSEVYDHHWIIGDAQHKNLLCPHAPNYVFGVGSESRNSPVNFPKGYGYVVKGWDSWIPWGANIHLLRIDEGKDLVGDDSAEAMKECNECFYAAKKGPSCSAERNGTFQCCGDACYSGTCFCPLKEGTKMTPKTYYLRLTVTYTTDIKAIRPLGVGVYTTPNCQAFYGVERNDEDPYHLSSTSFSVDADGSMLLAIGHQHVGAVNISMFLNDKFVCASVPRYGTTQGVAGNEKGFLVAMSECFSRDAGRTVDFRAGDKVRIDSWYYVGSKDPRIAPLPGGTHLNVMGYMYIAYDLEQTKLREPSLGPLPTRGCESAFHLRCGKLLGFPDECLRCIDEHRAALDAGGCEEGVGESMCKFRSPRGGMLDIVV